MRMDKPGAEPAKLAMQFVRGFCMGVADIVPGVSGGTIALIFGIYQRLVDNIHMGARALGQLVRLDGRQAVARLREVEWSFLLPLLLLQCAARLMDLSVRRIGFRILTGTAVTGYFFAALLDMTVSRVSPAFHDVPGGSAVLEREVYDTAGAAVKAKSQINGLAGVDRTAVVQVAFGQGMGADAA